MYDPQLSRREFLRGTARGAAAVPTLGLYEKAVVAAGGVAGVLGAALSASASHEVRRLSDEQLMDVYRSFVLRAHHYQRTATTPDFSKNFRYARAVVGHQLDKPQQNLQAIFGSLVAILEDATSNPQQVVNSEWYNDPVIKRVITLGSGDYLRLLMLIETNEPRDLGKVRLASGDFYLQGDLPVFAYNDPESTLPAVLTKKLARLHTTSNPRIYLTEDGRKAVDIGQQQWARLSDFGSKPGKYAREEMERVMGIRREQVKALNELIKNVKNPNDSATIKELLGTTYSSAWDPVINGYAFDVAKRPVKIRGEIVAPDLESVRNSLTLGDLRIVGRKLEQEIRRLERGLALR